MSKPLTNEELNSLDGVAEDCKTEGVHPQISFWVDVQAAVADIRELQDKNAKLREYVDHDTGCFKGCRSEDEKIVPCTCGLDGVLKDADEPAGVAVITPADSGLSKLLKGDAAEPAGEAETKA